jgi:hypothetical protein
MKPRKPKHKMKIRLDLQAHFWAGLAICLAASLFLGSIVGLTVAIIAGIAKELYDMTGRGTPDVMDAVATIVGGLVGFMLILISQWA